MSTELSRLGLGTAQWGFKYGVANTAGQPDQARVERMLEVAWEHGVNWLDTARGYGESEEVIGRALKNTGLQEKIHVVSKTCHIGRECAASDIPSAIDRSVTDSLRALGVERIPFLLVHNSEDILIPGVWERMLHQRDTGLVGQLGVSVAKRPAEAIEKVLELESVDVLQVAVNIWDQRLIRSGTLDKLAERGILVLVRSVYLQGLLVMPEESVPEHLSSALPFKKILADWSSRWARSPKELAMQFVLGLPAVTAVLLGCETESQILENAALLDAPPLTGEQMNALLQMPQVPQEIIEPWHWEGRAQAWYKEPESHNSQTCRP